MSCQTAVTIVTMSKKTIEPLEAPSLHLAPGNAAVIGVDCLALPEKFSGAAYYIFNLTRHLLEINRNFKVKIFCKPTHVALFELLLKPGDKIIAVPIRNRLHQLFVYEFRLGRLLRREKVSIFYATHYICPPRNNQYQIVATFHDMGFLLFPQYYPWIKRLYFGNRMKHFIDRAERIVAVSQSTAAGITRMFPQQAPKIQVIYPGINHIQQKENTAAVAEKPDFERPYILAVNTFERRKNIPFLIQVYNGLRQQGGLNHLLVLVGQPANDQKQVMREIQRSPFREDIILAHYVEDELLDHYYHAADFFINASVYEGFGFTPFEAIYRNTAAFLYRNNVIQELLGDHPYTIDVLNPEAWIERILEAYRNNFPDRIHPRQVSHMSWLNNARATRLLLEALDKRLESINDATTGVEKKRQRHERNPIIS